jgi:CHASE3 domain sensor protein
MPQKYREKPGGLPLLLLIVTPVMIIIQFIIAISLYGVIERSNRLVQERGRLETYLRNNRASLLNAESGQRGYLLTGDKSYLQPYQAALAKQKENENAYPELDNPEQHRRLKELKLMSDKKFAELALTVGLYSGGMRDSAMAIVNTGKGNLMMDSLRNETRSFLEVVTLNIADTKMKEQKLVGFFLLVMLLMLSFQLFFVYYGYRKFKAYNDSILQLLDSVEQSNAELKQYTRMSYHELKTPLRNITGFLRLLQRKYSASLDGEAHDFVQYITDGVRQMNDIIEDLRKKHLEK